MAIKSENEKGNPYHDESTGEFTSANNGSAGKSDSGKNDSSRMSFRLKSNFDINGAKADLVRINTNSIGTYREASSIEEANLIGRSILPDCLVNYSSSCDLEKVNELNKSLSDITNRFPGFVQNGLLNAFGDGLSLNEEEVRNVVIKSALNIIQKDKHFSRLYDEFFEKSKAQFGLSDTDKYNDKVFSHFMGFDRQFDIGEYTHKKSSSALAYYQVSQRNIYDKMSGGQGINGAIKIYNAALQKPTQSEINEYRYAVESGFHFDFGDHSYTYNTGVHELGHSIFTIAYKKCSDEERAEIDKIISDGFSKDRNQVSGYGHTNAYEQEAEAVADVMCRGDNATPHNKKMVAWLDMVHKRLRDAGEI